MALLLLFKVLKLLVLAKLLLFLLLTMRLLIISMDQENTMSKIDFIVVSTYSKILLYR
jgi:hypothetical protein